jgi:hypothetical protein
MMSGIAFGIIRILLGLAGVCGGTEDAGRSRSVAETAIASVKLGVPAAPNFRCSSDEPSDIETVHEFRAKDGDDDGRKLFLVVRTSCPMTKCRGEQDRKIISVAIQDSPELKQQCPLPAGVALSTSRGLQLGAPVQAVLRLYGKPTERNPRKGSPNNFHYKGRMGSVPTDFMVEFRYGRVSGIALFINEDEH